MIRQFKPPHLLPFCASNGAYGEYRDNEATGEFVQGRRAKVEIHKFTGKI